MSWPARQIAGLSFCLIGCAVLAASPNNATQPDAPAVMLNQSARVVVVPSLQRVFREDVQIRGENEAHIRCAKGETSSCQIVAANTGTQPLRNVNLKWTHLIGPEGTDPVMTLFRVHFVEVKRPSNLTGAKAGWYPDGLIPFVDPYTGFKPKPDRFQAAGIDIPAGQCQPYWLDVTVPRQCTAGDYRGLVRVTAEGFQQDVPINLKVWDFSLPESPALPTHFGLTGEAIQKNFQVAQGRPRYQQLLERSWAVFEEHRLSLNSIPPVPRDQATGHARVTKAYLAEVKSFIERRRPRICHIPLHVNWPFNDGLGADINKLATYLGDIDRMLHENPWIPPAFIYVIDEPRSESAYELLNRLGQVVRDNSTKILNLSTGELRTDKGWAPIEDVLDIWVYDWLYWDPTAVAKRKAEGKRVWCYTALSTKRRTPLWLTDAPILDYSVPFWICWSLKLDGVLYWRVLSKGISPEPWIDPITFKVGDIPFNGEGCLMLAGMPAGVDGPLPTVRMKAIRDGLQCYDYLYLLAERGGREISDRLAQKLAPSFDQWNPDFRVYLEAREQLAREILSRKASKRPAK